METNDIRPFIPVKDLEASKLFYEALGFTSSDPTSDMTIMSNGVCTFFLCKSDDSSHENNFMFQLSVPSVENTLQTIKNVKGISVKHEPIKEERWGKVIYMWGPSGEMWHISELYH